MKTITILSWNVNGLRAVLNKGFMKFLKEENPHILGIQETKLQGDQLPEEVHYPEPYRTSWNFAERKGYSGTGIFYRIPPVHIKTSGFGSEILEQEGRIIQMDYPDFTLFNIYFPNGQMSEERLRYKLTFYDEILNYFNGLKEKGKNLIIMGDVNTAHKPIDLKNPDANKDRSGFLPVERAWIDKLIDCGYTDTFRLFNQEGEQYTWWTYRFRAREKNIGWRIDYFFVNNSFAPQVRASTILSHIYGSDHCPIGLKINI
ncbi:MAG: exodeoxyribonuclease III [Candidatus Aminicenantes bacterium]|nr:exodeoxyribonuclease III [Candidatus Aminicenantes bacterium]